MGGNNVYFGSLTLRFINTLIDKVVFRKLAKNENLIWFYILWLKTLFLDCRHHQKAKIMFFLRKKDPTDYLVVEFCNRNRYAEVNYAQFTQDIDFLFFSQKSFIGTSTEYNDCKLHSLPTTSYIVLTTFAIVL